MSITTVFKICRCCLKSCENTLSIYNCEQIMCSAAAAAGTGIVDCIQEICDVTISPDDNLPESICLQCLDILKISYSFRLQVKKNYLFLINILKEDDPSPTDAPAEEEEESSDQLNVNYVPVLNGNLEIEAAPALIDENFEYQPDNQFEIISFNPEAAEEDNPDNSNELNIDYCTDKCKDYIEPSEYTCECGKSFKYLRNLKFHQKTHFVGPKKCPYCEQTFHKNYNLQRHIQSRHTKIKPFQCEICQKSFYNQTDVNRHLKYHTIVKEYKCLQCNQEFYENYSLQVHIRSVHLKERKFHCDRCDKKFSTIFKVRRHQKSKSCCPIPPVVVSTINIDDQLIIVDYNQSVVICNDSANIEKFTDLIIDHNQESINS